MMFGKLMAALGLGGSGGEAAPAEQPATEYKGYRIRPAPYRANSQYQTAGVIEKDFPDGVKQHRYVRAETHPSLDDAVEFALSKGRQIIDQEGDRIFR
jgi:hypothetical protein